MSDKFYIIIIILLILLISAMSYIIYCKRRDDIVKVAFYREPLPMAKPGTEWIQNSVCPMSDGMFGVIKGSFCERVQTL